MNIIWDLGGTLINTYEPVNAMLIRMVEEAGGEISELEMAMLTRVSIGSAMKEISKKFGIEKKELTEAYSKLKKSWKKHPAPLNPDTQECLARVREGGGLNMIVTHRDRESATTLLEQHNLDIDRMICAPDGYPRKPSPVMFLEMLKQTGLTADEVISVGDREIDIEAAQAAGLRAILIQTPLLPIDTKAERKIKTLLEVFDLD